MKGITVDQISSDRVTLMAKEFWSPDTKSDHKPYDPNLIEEIYQSEMTASDFTSRRVMVLELSQYLEKYLWPNYSEESTKSHLVSIVVLVNEKLRERVPPWTCFEQEPKFFSTFLRHLMAGLLEKSGEFSTKEQQYMLIFVNHLYNSLEKDFIREQLNRTVSHSILTCLTPGQLQRLCKIMPSIEKFMKKIEKYRKKLQSEDLEKFDFDSRFLYNLSEIFLDKLGSISSKGDIDEDVIKYCERYLEFVIDLESQLPTRRYFNTLLHNSNLLVKCSISPLLNREEGKLFSQLLDILKIYAHFEVSDFTAEPLTQLQVMKQHYDAVQELQQLIFDNFSDYKEFSFASVGSIDSRNNLHHFFKQMNIEDLQQISRHLSFIPNEKEMDNRKFLLEVLINRFERRSSQLKAINKMPLYPTETIIWDDNIVPSEYFSGDVCLALPKLNLQFLTLHDYLLRNFDLFRLESTYEIRQDIEDIVRRLGPWQAENGEILFRGWARMAHPITSFAVCEVARPNVGGDKPSRVRADVTMTLSVRPEIKREWEALRKHDVCLLLSIRHPESSPDIRNGHFPEEFGILHVRGCEIEGMLDQNGRVIEEGPEPKPVIKGDARTFRVWMDSNQYKRDMDELRTLDAEDVYSTFNVIMRRKPKENNFKAVLETIRDLMNTECVVPDWLLDIIVGYGDAGSAHYSKMENRLDVLDFYDTFLNLKHLKDSFPEYEITHDDKSELEPPFKLTFHENPDDDNKNFKKMINVASYTIENRGPYPYTVPRHNTIKFTPTQVEAIRSGMQPGLTMVVGPPGTGKTDVAVQIISNIYHNNPNERTLIVTHSNQALNQLFEKIMALDVDERHLLRLGHGEEALETEKDFSRYGRVNYVLNKRLELLEEVTRLKNSLGVLGEMGASCETAGYFFLQHILSRWEKFLSKVHPSVGKGVNISDIHTHFPFHLYFANAPQPLFRQKSFEADMEVAIGCFRYIENIFTQLKEFRAFEMLRSGLDRSRYLLIKEAKIIAMTCTHAALKRHELVDLGFQFDNILMEESAQILEIETFIPLLLQNPQDGRNRLKRWVMIGDHHQLPPVIKNMAFQKYSNMEQSLFTRFIRLGTPSVDLDAQGRARPSICSLYNWRYKKLGDLDHVKCGDEYKVANPGFFHDFQMINVEDLDGRGESEPRKYFYQNLAEAEYAVHLFMYMRLLGYPAQSISLLTTYNGQKALLKDVVEQRCANNPLFGRPNKISTVDKFQGQQNDFVILSLVRTKAVGHIRDVRRLIVAMSRARLGLYIFGRVELFKNCLELQPAFKKLLKRPLKLQLAPWETYPTERAHDQKPNGEPVVVEDISHMSALLSEMYQEACKYYQSQAEELQTQQAPGDLEPMQVTEEDGARSDSDEEQTVMIVNEV